MEDAAVKSPINDTDTKKVIIWSIVKYIDFSMQKWTSKMFIKT